MKDRRPLCPKCGCPARIVIVRSGWVKFQLLEDGTLGPVLRNSAGQRMPMETYECGGGHEWSGPTSAVKEILDGDSQ